MSRRIHIVVDERERHPRFAWRRPGERVIFVDADDVRHGRDLQIRHPGLSARDLLHMAVCARHAATGVLTYDRSLASAWGASRPPREPPARGSPG